MCGIVGLVTRLPPGEATSRVESGMLDLAHRGPDGEGLFLQATSGGGAHCRRGSAREALPGDWPNATHTVVVGHRRLAVIDRSSEADQPMCTADGRFVIALNGEIYNHLELRRQLEAAGWRFRTRSDTEVLLQGFAAWGLKVFDVAIGMFAVVILDRQTQTLLLSRDCFGMKPLYYATTDDGVGVSSEPGVLFKLLSLQPRVDPRGLADFLTDGLTDHRPQTMFAGIRAVPPASTVIVGVATGTVSEPARYWRPTTDAIDDRDPDDIARDLRDRLMTSVSLHLRADRPVGSLLSGGIDSSAIVMAMREVGGSNLDLQTFSYVPDGELFSEERWIDEVNARAGATAHKIRLTRGVWESEAGEVALRQGEPFGTLAVYAQSVLFRTAAEHGVHVLLDGQGADEVFGGYASFRAFRLLAHMARGELVRAAALLASYRNGGVPLRHTVLSGEIRHLLPDGLGRMARAVVGREPLADSGWLRENGVAPTARWRPRGRRWLQERLLDSIERTSLPALLRYADRSSMMHGVESRLPFLTRELVEFALALPDSLLVSDEGVGKAVLRRALRGLVPDSVLDRRDKVSFVVPLKEWLLHSPYARAAAKASQSTRAIDGRVIEPWLEALESGKSLPPRAVFLLWRAIGVTEWMRTAAVQDSI